MDASTFIFRFLRLHNAVLEGDLLKDKEAGIQPTFCLIDVDQIAAPCIGFPDPDPHVPANHHIYYIVKPFEHWGIEFMNYAEFEGKDPPLHEAELTDYLEKMIG